MFTIAKNKANTKVTQRNDSLPCTILSECLNDNGNFKNNLLILFTNNALSEF
jgi:hypothetical protein